jgi:hypothetical protein
MEEDWYAVEQEIRDRVTRARAAARVRTVVRDLAAPPPRRDSVAAALGRWASWITFWPTGRVAVGPTLHSPERSKR